MRRLVWGLAILVCLVGGIVAVLAWRTAFPPGIEVLQHWAQTQMLTVERASAPAPDGKPVADKLDDPVGAGQGTIFQDIEVVDDNRSSTFSIHFKKGTSRSAQFLLSYLGPTASKTYFAQINLNDITIVSHEGQLALTNVGDGWFKLELTGANLRSGMKTARVQVRPSVAEPAGPGSIYVWGARFRKN